MWSKAERLRPKQQMCKRCGAVDRMNFQLPVDIWAKVSGKYVQSVLCLACFDDLALEKGIDYVHHLSEVCFAGS